MSILACTHNRSNELPLALAEALPIHTSQTDTPLRRVYYTNNLSIRPYLTGAIRLLFGSTS